MAQKTKATHRREAAIRSGDANRILLAFARPVAVRLFHHSLNTVTASRLSDDELLQLDGIGPHAVAMIRKAMITAANRGVEIDGQFFNAH